VQQAPPLFFPRLFPSAPVTWMSDVCHHQLLYFLLGRTDTDFVACGHRQSSGWIVVNHVENTCLHPGLTGPHIPLCTHVNRVHHYSMYVGLRCNGARPGIFQILKDAVSFQRCMYSLKWVTTQIDPVHDMTHPGSACNKFIWPTSFPQSVRRHIPPI
jgi:hypothetical protein